MLAALIFVCALLAGWLLIELYRLRRRARPVPRARLEGAGASPGTPIEVSSAAIIEPRAGGMPCPDCGTAQRIAEHRAEQLAEGDRRIVQLACPRCGREDELYFHIVALH